ncbi:MAG: type II toxin-antitoxin system death-on-curing family toxin [Candidatus Peregrinibacteria bacterium]
MKRKYLYLTAEKALEIHEFIVRDNGGLYGVKDMGQIESVLAHIQNDDYYPEVFDKVTHLVFSFTQFHCFSDGNKRTALALGAFFLGINYSNALAEKFIIEMENVVVEVAKGQISKDLLREIIEKIFYEDEENEELLLKIFKSLSK